MVSVTSDVTASASYQAAPPKPALPDPSQISSSFAAMVDNNLPAATSSSEPPAPQSSPPPRASRDTSDNHPPASSQSAASQDPPPSRADQSSAADQPPPAATTDKGNPDTTQPAKSGKSDSAKADSGKPSDKASGGDHNKTTHATDSGTAPQATDTTAITATPDPIAALIAAVSAPANTPAQKTPAATNGPLAIAAAAIAATTSTTASLTAPAAPANSDGAKTAKTGAGDGATGTGKTPVQAPAANASAAQLTSTDPTAGADAALVAAAAPHAAKTPTGLKAAATGQTKGTTATGAQAATDPSATNAPADAAKTSATPQPVTEAKPVNATLADAVKPDGSGASAPAAHDHAQVAGNAASPTSFADVTAQVAAMPPQVSATTSAAASDKFTVTPMAGAAVPLSGLAVEIAATAQSGKTRFDVRLDPADLGRIDVRIDVDRNGQVTSHLTVEKPETLSMLQQTAPQLQQALSDAGLKTGNGGLQFSLRDQSSSGQNNNGNQTGGQPQRLVISEDDSVPTVMAGRSYGRMFGASGGVDIRV